jgi:predicted heme/steroid binding protein
MDDTPAEEWTHPLYLALKGIVFDIAAASYSNSWKKHNAGRDLTM